MIKNFLIITIIQMMIFQIIRTSTKKKLSIVCTEKDYIKIPQKFKKFINVAYLEINIFSSKKLIKLINEN